MTQALELKPWSTWRHVDGGYYRLLGVATDTDTLEKRVVYEHLWPFEQKLWVRPLAQWEERFKRVGLAEVLQARAGDREQAQQNVQRAKQLRRERNSV